MKDFIKFSSQLQLNCPTTVIFEINIKFDHLYKKQNKYKKTNQ